MHSAELRTFAFDIHPANETSFATPPDGTQVISHRLATGATCPLRPEHDLHTVVLLVLEHVVAARRLVERKLVRDDVAGVDVPVLDALEQRSEVALHVALAGLDRQR